MHRPYFFSLTLALSLFTAACTISQKQENMLPPYKDSPDNFWHLFQDKEGQIYRPIDYDPESPLTTYQRLTDNSWWRMNGDESIKFESVFFDNGADYYEHGLARFIDNHKVGFHNEAGEIIIPATYDFARPFTQDHGQTFAIVCQGCTATYRQKPRLYPASSSSVRNLISKCGCDHDVYEITGGKWGGIDLKGNIIVPLKHHSYEAVLNLLKKKAPTQNRKN